MLESLVQRYLEGTKAGLPDTGGSAQPAYPGSSLTLAMLDEALLAGLGPKRRKQSLRRMSERDAKLKGKADHVLDHQCSEMHLHVEAADKSLCSALARAHARLAD